MTTLEELVLLEPDPTHGYPIQIAATSGVWRWVCELADTTAGEYVEWFDITEWYVGDRHQFGADQYMGDARARLVTVQLQIDDSDLLAPWGLDTTELFGEDVELDAGLLMRGGLARVAGGVTVEWLPAWTGRVETWGDVSQARGQIRIHEVTVVDTVSDLANVPTIIEANSDNWDEWFTDQLLPAANWAFGVDIYGDTTSAGLPQDLSIQAAINRMDAGTDPLGLVWRSLRSGRMVIHPAPWDTTNVARYDNPLLTVYPDGLQFSYSPEFTEIEYIADDNGQPFGVQRTVAGVLNSLIVTVAADVYAIDDATSVSKFGVRPFQATWILENHPVVDDLLDARAFASKQALPLRTTAEHEGFMPGMAIVDHLDPITVKHQNAEGRPVVIPVGWVRNVVEDRQMQGRGDGADDRILSWQSTVQIDVASSSTAEALLPVEDLALVSAFTPGLGGPSGAEFSWTNPTQPTVTPTDVEIRVLGRSLIWNAYDYPGVGADGITLGFLEAATNYTFQVRLVRRVNGVATHVSPIRQLNFTTPANILPIPIPDGDDTDVEVGEPPDFDPDDCELEVELQENDGDPDTWTTVDTFTGSELTDNGDGTWSLTTPIDNSFFNEGSMYRFRSREVCGTVVGDWFTGTPFDPPDDWADPCTTPPALSDVPFADAIVYVPQICAPDVIREAVSGLVGVHGDALDSILAGVGDPTERALKAIADPEWSDTPGGILAYGECPQIVGVTGDKSWACRVNIPAAEACVLWECGAGQLRCVPTTAGWRASIQVYKTGATFTLTSATELDEGTTYRITATHDFETGDIKLYVDGVEDNDVGGSDNQPTINALPIWRVGAPPGAWITDCAVWDRVIDPNEIPGYQVPVTINQGSGQSDPAAFPPIVFDVVFAEPVTGFATGDVSLSGTAGATTATVTEVAPMDGTTYQVDVTGMTGDGTVIATIAAGVCTSVATGAPNAASTSSDNTVTYAAFNPITGVGWHAAYWAENLALSNGASVSTWPDDIGSEDLTGGANTPVMVTSDASFNGHKSVHWVNDHDRGIGCTGGSHPATQAQPFAYVIIGKADSTPASGTSDRMAWASGTAALANLIRFTNGSAAWGFHAGGTERTGGTPNTSPHVVMAYWNGSSSRFEVDGGTISSGLSAGTDSHDGITLGYNAAASTTNVRFDGRIVFAGVYYGDPESDGGWAAFKTWCLSFYGITVA